MNAAREYTAEGLLKHWGVQTTPEPIDVRVEASPVPPDYPRSFAEFVGQAEVIHTLKVEADAVRRTGRTLTHLLLTGPPGLGKTALAHVLASELDMSVYASAGPEFTAQQSMSAQEVMLKALGKIGQLYANTQRPVLWQIDEIDEMARSAVPVIYSLMTHNYVTWGGDRWGGIPISIFGTTNNTLSGPLVSRFGEPLDMSFYSPVELAEIARRTARRKDLTLTEEAAILIGQNAGGEPRKVNNRIMRNVANLVSPGGSVGVSEVREALRLSGLRHRGLTRTQYRYLEFLDRMPNRTASIASIAAYLGRRPKDVQYDIEPFLIRSGPLSVIVRTGRQLTDEGIKYLLEARGTNEERPPQ